MYRQFFSFCFLKCIGISAVLYLPRIVEKNKLIKRYTNKCCRDNIIFMLMCMFAPFFEHKHRCGKFSQYCFVTDILKSLNVLPRACFSINLAHKDLTLETTKSLISSFCTPFSQPMTTPIPRMEDCSFILEGRVHSSLS